MKKLIIKKPAVDGEYPWLIKVKTGSDIKVCRRGVYIMNTTDQVDKRGKPYIMKELIDSVDKVMDFPKLLAKIGKKKDAPLPESNGLIGKGVSGNTSLEWFKWVMEYIHIKKVCEEAGVNYAKVINFRAGRTKGFDPTSIEKIREVVETLHKNQSNEDDV